MLTRKIIIIHSTNLDVMHIAYKVRKRLCFVICNMYVYNATCENEDNTHVCICKVKAHSISG